MIGPQCWQQDENFVAWMLEEHYVERDDEKLHSHLSEGHAIYMWKAWCAGRQDVLQVMGGNER